VGSSSWARYDGRKGGREIGTPGLVTPERSASHAWALVWVARESGLVDPREGGPGNWAECRHAWAMAARVALG